MSEANQNTQKITLNSKEIHFTLEKALQGAPKTGTTLKDVFIGKQTKPHQLKVDASNINEENIKIKATTTGLYFILEIGINETIGVVRRVERAEYDREKI